MGLENKISKEMTPVYVTNNFSQYLEILPLQPVELEEPPKLKLSERAYYAVLEGIYSCINSLERIIPESKEQQEKRKQEEGYQQEISDKIKKAEEKEEELFVKAGIDTQLKKYAFRIADSAGLCLRRQAYLLGHNNVLTMPLDVFETYVSAAVKDGIRAVRCGDRYLEAKDVNPDFEGKATAWLLKEIYSRQEEEEFVLLSAVKLKQEDEKMTMTWIDREPEDQLK